MHLGFTLENFMADTTEGPINFYDWQRNSWVVLFSYPSDFSPVCLTELSRMAVRAEQFTKRNTKCLAHSVDELSQHNVWIEDLKSIAKITGKFPFPIISDPSRKLAKQFGMIDEEHFAVSAVTIRGMFVIDPFHKVRLATYYPLSCGRSLDEIIRTVDSLQLTDRYRGIGTPESWTSGGGIMIYPTVSEETIKNMFPRGYTTTKMPSNFNYVKTTDYY